VRIDYLLKDNRYFLIEVNTVPGMSAASIVPQQAEAFGFTTTKLFTIAMNDALDRSQA
jgi:D-alanine-D-alanine ligase